MNNITDLPFPLIDKTLFLLSTKDRGRASLVCKKWNTLLNNSASKKKDFNDLIKNRLLKPGNIAEKNELRFIASMLDEPSTTTKVVSKFIRSCKSDSELDVILKVIKIAKNITTEHLTDALDVKAPLSILQALTTKIPEISDSCITLALKTNDDEALKLFLESHKTTISKDLLLSKTFEHRTYGRMKFIFEIYPKIEISVSQMISVYSASAFEIILNQFLKKEGVKISIEDLELFGNQAMYLENKEKTFELIAKAYIKTNGITDLESLMSDFDCDVFIRQNKYPTLAAKLIESAITGAGL